jgi:FkbM family methyltransferase
MNNDEIYVFGNGLRVYRCDLITDQEERYSAPGNPNLHEPVEESLILETFEKEMPWNPVFLDIGARIGYYSMLIKSRWPRARVIAVEALPRHALCIRSNLRLNDIPVNAVEIQEIAVAENDGRAPIARRGPRVGYDSRARAAAHRRAAARRRPVRADLCRADPALSTCRPGGYVIVDNYGHWRGCVEAVGRFFRERGAPFPGERIDYTCYGWRV